MISSINAHQLGYKSTTLLKVCFRRKINDFDKEGFTLINCIRYLQQRNLKSDYVITTHCYYVFQQSIIIRDASAFIYHKKSPSVIYCFQKYITDANDDLTNLI